MKNSTRRSFLRALAALPIVGPLLAAETEPNPDYGKLSEPTFKTIPLDRISELDLAEIYDDPGAPLEAFADFLEAHPQPWLSLESQREMVDRAARDRLMHGDWANDLTPEAGRPQPDRGPSAPRR